MTDFLPSFLSVFLSFFFSFHFHFSFLKNHLTKAFFQWSIDQDNTAGDSMNDLMGIGTANGVSEVAATSFKEQMANATLQNAIASSCYWSLCGGECTTGYFDVTGARGQIVGFQQNSVCSPGEVQTLCCAPGTTMGT